MELVFTAVILTGAITGTKITKQQQEPEIVLIIEENVLCQSVFRLRVVKLEPTYSG